MGLVQNGHGDTRGERLSGWTTYGVLQAASHHVSRRTVRPRPQRQTPSRNGVTPPALSALTVPSRCPPHAGGEKDGLRSKGPWESHGIGRRSPGDVEGRGVSSSGDAMTTVETPPMDRWETLPWKQLQRNVFKLQNRIYRASCRDDSPNSPPTPTPLDEVASSSTFSRTESRPRESRQTQRRHRWGEVVNAPAAPGVGADLETWDRRPSRCDGSGFPNPSPLSCGL